MLTLAQYTSLWTNPAPNGFAQPIATLPDYDYYVIRENQYQDYLDIFRKRNTRTERETNSQAPNGGWYYEHPFFNDNIPKYPYSVENLNPKIQYFLIGEAAPPLNPVIPPGSEDTETKDSENTYFYDIIHGTSEYFTAPCSAFKVEKNKKAKRLFNLAMAGVVLIDLFPFSVNYSTNFRAFLNDKSITKHFWTRSQESVGVRIVAIKNLVGQNPGLAFIAPPKISQHIAEGINEHHWQVFNTNFRLGVNQLNPPIIPAGPPYPPFIANIPAGTSLIGLPPHIYILPLGSNPTFTIQVPTYACCAYSGSGQAPHELFIRNAFGLP
jgi:hypothetical protein